MILNIRKSKDNVWGFPETFKKYSYDGIGYVEVNAVVTTDGELSAPYVYRAEQFIPASKIDEEMGIEKYIKAKKPFYSLLNDGFVVTIRAGVDFINKKHLPEKTSYSVYNISKLSSKDINSGSIQLVGILELPENVKSLLDKLSVQVAECNGNRVAYLKSRFRDYTENAEEGLEVTEEDEVIEE